MWVSFFLLQDFSLFKKFRFSQGEQTLPLQVLLPENFDQGKISIGYFLHGRGKVEMIMKQRTHGAKKKFSDDSNRKNFPQQL